MDAPFHDFGEQPLWEITLRRNSRRKVIRATDQHRWFLKHSKSGREKGPERLTRELQPGQRLAASFPVSRAVKFGVVPSPFGVARGITFGDGHRAGDGSQAGLYHGKDTELLKWFPLSDTYESDARITVTDLPAYFKTLPDIDESASYLYGWLAGYFAADGCVAEDGDAILSSADAANLEFARTLCTRLGIGTFAIARQDRVGIDGRLSAVYNLRLMTEDLTPDFFLLGKHRLRFEAGVRTYSRRHWVVESVRPTDCVERVYCAVVDRTHSFVLEDNILTGNCFGCGVGGDVIRFVQEVDKLDFAEAVERLADRAGISLRYLEGSARAAPARAAYPADRGAHRGGAVLRRAACRTRGDAGARVPRRARLRPVGRRAVQLRVRARPVGTRSRNTCWARDSRPRNSRSAGSRARAAAAA